MSQSTPTDHEIDVYAGEFVLTGDKSKSWRKTFPKSKAKQDVIWTNAQKMHNFAQVLARIGELQVETAQKDAIEFDMSASELKRVLKSAIDAGLGGKVDSEGNSSPANIGAAVSAVSEWNRMNGNHAAQKLTANVITMSHEEWLESLDE